MEGWLGDYLLESTPCFIVAEPLANELQRAGLTGFRLDEAEVTKSEQFQELSPARELPRFLWLKVEGEPGKADFGLDPALRLVVSERALEVLKRGGVSHATIVVAEPGN
jgi:hypothetical protein